MAVWQFQFNIVPRRDDIEKLNRDEIISWKDVQEPTQKIEFLEWEASWSKEIVQYGKIDETCIEFIYDSNTLEEIVCRMDLRNLTKQKFILLIEYVQKIDAMFLVGDMVYPPKIEILVELMKLSEANRYCQNPLEFFSSLDF